MDRQFHPQKASRSEYNRHNNDNTNFDKSEINAALATVVMNKMKKCYISVWCEFMIKILTK